MTVRTLRHVASSPAGMCTTVAPRKRFLSDVGLIDRNGSRHDNNVALTSSRRDKNPVLTVFVRRQGGQWMPCYCIAGDLRRDAREVYGGDMRDDIEQGLDGHASATEGVDMRLLATLLHIRFHQRCIGNDRRVPETAGPAHR